MKLEDIGFYTLSNYRVKQASMSSPLWRCELVLTDNCNFKCAYCRGLKDDCKEELPLEYAKNIVNYWADEGLKNIRFSGGEPTLYKGLRELISLSAYRGIKRIALSTNGSASLTYYKDLFHLGVNDFSISLDACCSSYGDEISGVANSWNKVIKNIEELSKLTYVTVGVVLTEENISQAKDIIDFAHGLGVADIRVIPSAQYNKNMGSVNEIKQEVLDAHPILKYRMNNLLAGKSVRGLKETDMNRCPLTWDDMAISGNYHFPCIIYMREHGQAIGRTDNLEQIRKDRFKWGLYHNTFEDPICRKNCLDVCVQYNNKIFND